MSAEKTTRFIASAFILAIGFATAGFFVGHAISDFRRADRSVAVKGLVEREVRADVVQWTINFVNSGNDLAPVYAKAQSDQAAVLAFLKEGGLEDREINAGLRVADQQAKEYGDANRAARFIVQNTVTVDSAKVDAVAALAQKLGDLVQKNVVLGDTMLGYRFTGLNNIKPEMLAEATKNARAAAAQFAADSNADIGGIKRANQGVFTIVARGQDYDNGGTIDKTVRVVTTVEYFLD